MVSARESASLRKCEYRIASYRLPHLADKDALDRTGPPVFRGSQTFLPLARTTHARQSVDVTARRRAAWVERVSALWSSVATVSGRCAGVSL